MIFMISFVDVIQWPIISFWKLSFRSKVDGYYPINNLFTHVRNRVGRRALFSKS